ncbi:MAG: hypothetical protein RLZZ450_5833 [Pseudomonadota bacterium]|jgi:uncharacterized protein (TIGR03382 family)
MLFRRSSFFLALPWLFASSVAAQPVCESERACSFKKPNIMLLLDYSSSMTGFEGAPAWFPSGQTSTTRWGAELDAAGFILRYREGFFADNARIGLTRFAGDPDPKRPASHISTDTSFPLITDGFAIDVPFDGTNGEYLECKGSGVDASLEVLRRTPPPPAQLRADFGSIALTWTRGALASARGLIDRTKQSHQGEPGEAGREYQVVLMTDGDWTCPNTIGQNCPENPAPEAALLRAAGVPVHVIAFGDAVQQPSLNEIALQGGTGSSIDATSPEGIIDAFSSVLDRIRDGVIVPTCTQKLARVMVTMDASTSMIATNAPGQSKWDKARFALAGNPSAPLPSDPGYVESVLQKKVSIGGREVAIEDVAHFGMVAFAGAAEQKLIVNLGPCMRDNLSWAMDPKTSCKAPGCTNPYGGYPTTWTFLNSDRDRAPPFVRTTQSYMPACNQTPGSTSCVGQQPTTFTGQGLAFTQRTIAAYKQHPAPFALDKSTPFVNVLITDGQTSEGSTSVETVLRALVADGIDTYVIGFGSGDELDRAELDRYAGWGNTKSALVIDPQQSGAVALANALAGVVSSLGLSSCCILNHCASEPEPKDPGAVCGDGRVEGVEKCDDGADNAKYGHCGGRCTGPHLYCGDARIDGPEQCDDGNTLTGDGCDARCLIEVEPASDGSSMDGGAWSADAGDARVSRPTTIRPLGAPLDASIATTAPRGQAPRDEGKGSEPGESDDAAPTRSRDGGCAVGGEKSAYGAWTWLVLGVSALLRRRKKTLLADRSRVAA